MGENVKPTPIPWPELCSSKALLIVKPSALTCDLDGCTRAAGHPGSHVNQPKKVPVPVLVPKKVPKKRRNKEWRFG